MIQKTATANEYSNAETAKRMEDALRRALNTPHKPHAPLKASKSKAKRAKSPKRKRAATAA